MFTEQPQFLYIILVLPALFGLVLFGDGINKIVHQDSKGYINMLFGFVFLGVVIFAYFFFSIYLKQNF